MLFLRACGRYARYIILLKIIFTIYVFLYFKYFSKPPIKKHPFVEPLLSRDLQNLISDTLPKLSYPRLDTFETQNFDNEVFVYSAFVDLRNGNMGYPKIRILTIMKSEIAFRCHFKIDQEKFTTSATFYQTTENHHKLQKIYFISCTIPDEQLIFPWRLNNFLLERKHTGTSKKIRISNVLFDDRNLKFNYKYNYTLCVPTLFGQNYPPKYLIEFIEITTLLGADHFYFYIEPDIYANYAHILNYYQKLKRLTFVNFTIPYPATSHTWNHGQSLVANDCIYRNIGHSKYVILNDLDEYLVPYARDNWSDLFGVNSLWKDAIAGYCVQAFYFWIKQWHNPNQTLVQTDALSTSNIADKLLTKCIIKPERIFEQGIHHVSRTVQDYYHVEKLEIIIGALHHYKTSVLGRHKDTKIDKRRLTQLVEKNPGFLRKLDQLVKQLT